MADNFIDLTYSNLISVLDCRPPSTRYIGMSGGVAYRWYNNYDAVYLGGISFKHNELISINFSKWAKQRGISHKTITKDDIQIFVFENNI